jgi:hypothetical protein
MTHPLDGAFAKFDAALAHFDTLHTETNAYLGEPDKPYDLFMEFNDRENYFSLVGKVLRDPPLRISTLIGDVVHNLASSLDNAMFELAKLRTGREIALSSFPKYGDIRDFRRWRRRRDCWMRDLTAYDRTLIQRFQPYRGGDFAFNHPMAQLHRLWNQDKHRTPHTTLAMISEYGIRVEIVQDISALGRVQARLGPVVDGAEVLRVNVIPDGPDPQVKLQSELTMDIAVDEGIQIRNQLATIGDMTEHILGRVSKAFPESPTFNEWRAAQGLPPLTG